MKLRTFLIGAAAAVMLAVPGHSAELTLKFGHVGKPGSLFEASVNTFAACSNKALGNKAEVQTFGSSQLGKDKELLQKLKLGQTTFSLPSTVMSSVADEFGVFEMPYIIKDRGHMRRVWAELGDTFQKAVQAKGYRVIGLFENGFRHITNNVRPINVPGDLAGIKLRTPKGAWRVKMFKSYGANPTPMAFSEVFTALQTNVIDGQENPYAQIASAKFQEVQKYLSVTNHIITPYVWFMNREFYDGLSPEHQQIISWASEVATEAGRSMSRIIESSQNGMPKLAEKMEVNVVAPAEQAKFATAAQPAVRKLIEEKYGAKGTEMLDAMLKSVEQEKTRF